MRNLGPRATLAALCVLVVVVAWLAPGHSVESMDVRTYAQMTRGVVDSGLTCWDAGPVTQFPELLVPWAIPSHGRVCGIYGPLFPYLGAPAYALGGLVGLARFSMGLTAAIAVATFFLARRVLRDEWLAVAAAYVAALGTPVAARSMETAAFPLSALCATLGTYATIRALESSRRAPLASLVAGLLWAAAAASHAVCFAMALAGVGILVVGRRPAGAMALVGLVVGLAPSALLNHYRFGTWSPLSYGPIPWAHTNPELHKMTLGAQLAYALPLVAVVGLGVVGLWLLRHHLRLQLVVAMAAVVIVVLVPELRLRAVRYVTVMVGLLFDLDPVEMDARYTRAPDGVGTFFGPHVVKSVLQCTPLLALAPAALAGAGRERARIATLLVPAVALVVTLVTRGNLAYVDAIGWPWVSARYVLPMLPALCVAAFVVVQRLRLTRLHALVAVAVVAAVVAAWWPLVDDQSWIKRVFLLRGSLVLAVVAAGAACWSQGRGGTTLARWSTTGLLALSLATGLGHDLRAEVLNKAANDRVAASFLTQVPERFALVGVVGQFDVVLSALFSRDVEYADPERLSWFGEMRPSFDRWHREGRPVFVYWTVPPRSPWPDITFVQVGPDAFLYRAVFTNDAP